MGSVGLRKVWRDMWLARGRVGVMVVAIAVSNVALGAVLGAYGILSREMPPSFLGTNPAAATIVVRQSIDPELLAAVREQDGVTDAQARALVSARVEVAPNEWLPLSLFVVDDFEDLRIETVAPIRGAWPPPTGTLLIEQTALPVLGAVTNGPLTVQMPSGRTSSIAVAGVVSDRALAPAWQEQRGYAYITPDTLAWLGEPPTLDQLKISVADEDRFDADAIERTARGLSGWLQTQGHAVEEIRIPPPGEHPHQRLMNALVTVLLLFSALLLALSAVVIATLVTGMLSRHVRQIGAMKAIGASTRQVGEVYGMMMLLIATLTVLVSLPLSTLAGQRLAEVFAALSNVELRSEVVPPFAYALEIAVGLSLPLLAATIPIVKASRMTVREAVTEIGLFSLLGGDRSRWLPAWLTRALGPTLALGVRNVVRRRGRLGLSLGLLAVGGGTFMAGLNVAAAADARMAAMEASRGYDVDVRLNRPTNADSLLQLVGAVPGIAYVEPIDFSMVTPVREGEMPIAGTHKDGGHGSMPLWAVSATTRYPNRLVAGRALEPGETDAVVVGRSTLNALQASIGGTVALAIDGRITRWRVVGTVEGFGLGGGSGVFTTDAGFAQAMGTIGQTRGLRIETTRHDSASRDATMSELTRALTASNLAIVDASQAEWTNTVLRNHIAIVQAALQLLGIVVGGVGVFTLASAMSTSVAERAREFGVMQTLGATPTRISLVVMFEGLLIGLLSWAGAIAVGAVLSSLLGVFVGVFLFDAALPLTIASLALGAWLVLALFGCAVAGLIPASVAARMTIRETLAYS